MIALQSEASEKTSGTDVLYRPMEEWEKLGGRMKNIRSALFPKPVVTFGNSFVML